ncbi:hypothetical protein EDC04DRAFT_2640623 [Pisolithus marmoratus]|nr:hypothetical protein EDC04DRAFT_2640623 [Pisolithus marmoratus]
MSDQSPPPTKPKPGSLRDRIAAFENKGAPTTSAPGSGTATAAPAPRPKPGNLQWKPKPPSPSPTSPDQASKIPGIGGGMSASDAKESISRGGTLKERMAALQGKGAFGAPAPPPAIPSKPAAVEKPKWKPPPAISSPPADDDGVVGRAASRSPPYRRSTSPPSDVLSQTNEAEAKGSPPPEGDRTSPDPEDEERHRRATIAARMARLGGARIGMAPPIISPKPVVRKPTAPAPEPKQEGRNVESPEANRPSDVPVEGPSRELVGSPSAKEETAEELVSLPERRDSDQASIGSCSSNRTPVAMPVPAAPRRAAPPRRKTYKSAPSGPLPEVPVAVSDSELPDSEPITTTSPPSSSSLLSATEASKAETSQQISVTSLAEALVAGEAHHEVGIVEEPVDICDDTFPSGEGGIGAVLTEQPIVNEPEGDMEEEGRTREPGGGGQGSLQGSSSSMIADDEHGYVPSVQELPSHVRVEPDLEQGKELEEQDEDEDDEARRKRVATRLAQMGAFNPLAGPPPVPRHTSIEESHSKEDQLDVEDEVNVDTEEVGEHAPSPPTAAVPHAVHQAEEEFEHVSAEVEVRSVESDIEEVEVEAVNVEPVERDGEY